MIVADRVADFVSNSLHQGELAISHSVAPRLTQTKLVVGRLLTPSAVPGAKSNWQSTRNPLRAAQSHGSQRASYYLTLSRWLHASECAALRSRRDNYGE